MSFQIDEKLKAKQQQQQEQNIQQQCIQHNDVHYMVKSL